MNQLHQLIHFPPNTEVVHQEENSITYRIQIDNGFGVMTFYFVMPGIQLIINHFHCYNAFQSEQKLPGIIEINHCLRGKFECIMPDGRVEQMGPQDFSVSDMAYQPKKSVFPLGEYYGISLMVNIRQAEQSVYQMIGEPILRLSELFDYLLSEHSLLLLRSDPKIQHIFSELYDMEPSYQTAYFRLKVVELFLFLSRRKDHLQLDRFRYLDGCTAQHMEEIASWITQDLRQHFSLATIAHQYKISQTTLKKNFQKTYGMPPYTYLKRKRMEKAAFLLQTTRYPILEIAEAVGYKNPSKFSKVFADMYGVCPREYKKQYSQHKK